jgi:hypothetical protein
VEAAALSGRKFVTVNRSSSSKIMLLGLMDTDAGNPNSESNVAVIVKGRIAIASPTIARSSSIVSKPS